MSSNRPRKRNRSNSMDSDATPKRTYRHGVAYKPKKRPTQAAEKPIKVEASEHDDLPLRGPQIIQQGGTLENNQRQLSKEWDAVKNHWGTFSGRVDTLAGKADNVEKAMTELGTVMMTGKSTAEVAAPGTRNNLNKQGLTVEWNAVKKRWDELAKHMETLSAKAADNSDHTRLMTEMETVKRERDGLSEQVNILTGKVAWLEGSNSRFVALSAEMDALSQRMADVVTAQILSQPPQGNNEPARAQPARNYGDSAGYRRLVHCYSWSWEEATLGHVRYAWHGGDNYMIRNTGGYIPEEAHIHQAKVTIDNSDNVWAHVKFGPLAGEKVPMGNVWALEEEAFSMFRITKVDGQWEFREDEE